MTDPTNAEVFIRATGKLTPTARDFALFCVGEPGRLGEDHPRRTLAQAFAEALTDPEPKPEHATAVRATASILGTAQAKLTADILRGLSDSTATDEIEYEGRDSTNVNVLVSRWYDAAADLVLEGAK